MRVALATPQGDYERPRAIAAAVAELPSCTPAAKNELFLLAAELARGARMVTARYDAPFDRDDLDLRSDERLKVTLEARTCRFQLVRAVQTLNGCDCGSLSMVCSIGHQGQPFLLFKIGGGDHKESSSYEAQSRKITLLMTRLGLKSARHVDLLSVILAVADPTCLAWRGQKNYFRPTTHHLVGAFVRLGALDAEDRMSLSPLGRQLARLHVHPVLGKLLLLGELFDCFDVALTVAAGLGSKSPFVCPLGKEPLANAAKARLADGTDSDHVLLERAYAEWRAQPGYRDRRSFCDRFFLSHQTLEYVDQLRRDLGSGCRDLLKREQRLMKASDARSVEEMRGICAAAKRKRRRIQCVFLCNRKCPDRKCPNSTAPRACSSVRPANRSYSGHRHARARLSSTTKPS